MGARIGDSLAVTFLNNIYTTRKRINLNPFSLWTVGGNVTGSGSASNRNDFLRHQTGATASSTVVSYATLAGLAADNATYGALDWSKELWAFFGLRRVTSEAQTIVRVQIKQSTAIADLGAAGLGVRINNLALVGESYGSQRNTTTLLTMVSGQTYIIGIHHRPSVPQIDWYVDGVLTGTEATAANIPTTAASAEYEFLMSTENGASGGTNAEAFLHPDVELIQTYV